MPTYKKVQIGALVVIFSSWFLIGVNVWYPVSGTLIGFVIYGIGRFIKE